MPPLYQAMHFISIRAVARRDSARDMRLRCFILLHLDRVAERSPPFWSVSTLFEFEDEWQLSLNGGCSPYAFSREAISLYDLDLAGFTNARYGCQRSSLEWAT